MAASPTSSARGFPSSTLSIEQVTFEADDSRYDTTSKPSLVVGSALDDALVNFNSEFPNREHFLRGLKTTPNAALALNTTTTITKETDPDDSNYTSQHQS